jgi:hypothetical protein
METFRHSKTWMSLFICSMELFPLLLISVLKLVPVVLKNIIGWANFVT